jgi:hypothetical protein
MGDRCYRIKDAGMVDASDAEPDIEAEGDDGAVEDDGDAGDAGGAFENDAAPNDASVPSINDSGTDGGCADGHVLQDGACADIDECFEGMHACHTTAKCENTEGSYDCTCPLGYSGGSSAGFACAPRIAVGHEGYGCVLLLDGSVQCWGGNSSGQLGDGTQTSRTTPVTVNGLTDVAVINAGGESTCAILRDGTLRCWGDNTAGQLGDGSRMNRAVPVPTQKLTGVVAVAMGQSHACATLKGGAIKCWGQNSSGQLGTGSSTAEPILTPVAATVVDSVANVFVGFDQTCAILRSGAAQCWGYGYLGEPSDGPSAPRTSSLTPVDVDVPRNVATISIGNYHVCALAGTNTFCWGDPLMRGGGAMGTGPAPVAGAGSGRAVVVGFGSYATHVLQPGGTVIWWFTNKAPAPFPGVTGAVVMSASWTKLCDIRMDGSVNCIDGIDGMYRTVPGLDLW